MINYQYSLFVHFISSIYSLVSGSCQLRMEPGFLVAELLRGGEGAESAEESRRVWHLLCEAGFQGKDSERIKICQMPPLSWLL